MQCSSSACNKLPPMFLSLSHSLSLSVCPLSISPRRCLFLWLLNCLRESSERQRSEEIIMRCALSYFDLGHVSHNSSGPLSPSSHPCFPALPPPPLPIIFAIVEFSSVVCLSCSWSHESFGRTISVELIGIGSTSGYPTITLPYHVFFLFFFFAYRKLPQQRSRQAPWASLRFLFVSLPSSSFVILLFHSFIVYLVYLLSFFLYMQLCFLTVFYSRAVLALLVPLFLSFLCWSLSRFSFLFMLGRNRRLLCLNNKIGSTFVCMSSNISGTVWVRAPKFGGNVFYYCQKTYKFQHAYLRP